MFSRGGGCLMGAKWTTWKKRRKNAVNFLTAERNTLNREAFFREEKERVKKYDELIDFLNALEFNEYAKVCPMCKKPMYAIAKVDSCSFYGVGKANSDTVGLTHNLQISHCYACGFTTVSGF